MTFFSKEEPGLLSNQNFRANMNEQQTTLLELQKLLEMLPGVTIESMTNRTDYLSLVLLIEKLESVGPVTYAAQGANILFDLSTVAPRLPVQARSVPSSLRFAVAAKGSASEPEVALEAIQLFGIFLIHYLNGTGVLADERAHSLLAEWKGYPLEPQQN